MGHGRTRGSGQGGFKMLRVGSGWLTVFYNGYGSGRVENFSNLAWRVGSRGCEIARVGSGRVGSGQEVWKSGGSGRVMTREIQVAPESIHHDPRVEFSADPGVEPVHLACGFGFSNAQLPVGCPCRACAPRTRLAGKMIQSLPLPEQKPLSC